jgi:spore germination protein KC
VRWSDILKKTMKLLLIFITLTGTTGCRGHVETTELAIVVAMVVDKMDNQYRVALQIAIPMKLGPTGQGGGGTPGASTFVISDLGETIMAAYQNVQKKLPRRLFFSQCRVLIIGEQLARDGVAPILDFFPRQREIRMLNHIMFTKGSASRLLNARSSLERVPAEEIRKKLELDGELSVTVLDFLNMMLSDGSEPVADRIGMRPMLVKKNENEQPEPENKDVVFGFVGAAVFKKDKLVGWLNNKETRGLMWLRGSRMRTDVITVDVPNEKGGGKISVQLLKSKTSMKPTLKDNKLKMGVVMQSDVEIYENNSKLDVSNLQDLTFVQKLLANDISERAQLTLRQAQEKFKSDILGFGLEVYRTFPKEWNETYKESWDRDFPKLQVTIVSQVKVVRIGLTQKSIELMKQ